MKSRRQSIDGAQLRKKPGAPATLWRQFSSTFAAKEACLADIGEGWAMDDDYPDLTNRLFVAATDLIETAHGLAIAGQSGTPTAADHAATGCRLQAAAREIAIIAEAAVIIANLGNNQRRNRRKRPR